MTIVSTFSDDDKVLTIEIIDSLSFEERNAFRATYRNREISRCILNMNATKFIDSSALAMLLLLKDALHTGVVVSIIHCNPQIKKALLSSRFDKKFSIK